jgi:hypothetical protein
MKTIVAGSRTQPTETVAASSRVEAAAEATEKTEAITKAGEHFRTSISFELVVSNDHPSHMK